MRDTEATFVLGAWEVAAIGAAYSWAHVPLPVVVLVAAVTFLMWLVTIGIWIGD